MGVIQLLSKVLLETQGALTLRRRANRVAPALSSKWDQPFGVGQSWVPMSYGEYYPRSAFVYSAIKVRQDAIVRVPLRVVQDREVPRVRAGMKIKASARGSVEPIEPSHPVQALLDSPNPFWSRGDLWRATETYLGLWGSAYWGLERDEQGIVTDLWPLRSDKMRVVPDPDRYIKGFVYLGGGQQLIPYVPEDIVWIRYFNPLDEHAGLSPVAPLRLSIDMGIDALRANRNNLANDSTPGLFVETSDSPTDDEVKEFYQRWESRFRGVEKVRRPVLLSGGMKAANLGFSPRDMEYIQSLRWSLEDAARVYGVPKAMLGEVERLTFSNFQTARRVFWEDTIVPQLMFYQETLQNKLLPNLGLDVSGLTVQYDLIAVEALQESENDRAQRHKMYVTTGILTINEVRNSLGLPSVAWGDTPPGAVD